MESIEKSEIKELEELESKILSILDITKEIVDEFGKPGLVTEERKEKTKQLAITYLKTEIKKGMEEKQELLHPYLQLEISNYSTIENQEVMEHYDESSLLSMLLNFNESKEQ